MDRAPGMEWVDGLQWVDLPVADDGGEAPIGSRSTLRAHVGWEITREHATPVSVLLRHTDGRPVTPAEWRGLKSSEIIAASREWIRGAGLLALLDPEIHATGEALGAVLEAREEPVSVGRARYGDDHYRRVARVYNEAVRTGDTQPVQAVRLALRSEFPSLKDTTVRGWIQAAKRRGHITQTVRPSRAKKGGDHGESE